MGENISANNMTNEGLISQPCKQLIQYNIPPPKKSNLIKKMDRKLELTFFQRRYTDGDQTHEKMFNIINHRRNAD